MRISSLISAAQPQLFDTPTPVLISQPVRPTFPPTVEMQRAVDMALTREDLKIVAYAGAGKTSTLVSIAHAMPRSMRGVYAAFNKSIATEAGQRFPRSVKCSTFHSLAYRATRPQLLQKLQYARMPGRDIASIYGVRDTKVRTLTGTDAVVESHSLGGIIADTVARFCRTAAITVLPEHVRLPDLLANEARAELVTWVVPRAQAHWDNTMSVHSPVPLSHDSYLKAWALSAPDIRADFILFDEAQDADGVMLDVLAKQQAQVIYVGDPYQQIYEWRGAINALDAIQAEKTYLTRSFRFGPNIARAANILLGFLGEDKPLLGTDSIASDVAWQVDGGPEPVDALLCRTNAVGIREAVSAHSKGVNICLQVNTAEILGFADAAEALQAGQRPAGSEFRLFRDWNDLVNFSETIAGSEFRPNVKLVSEHGVPMLRDAIHRSVPAERAQLTISTAHRAKGLEWDRVRLADDFRLGRQVDGHYVLDESEARLDYVALTRARRFVDVSALTPLIEEASRELNGF